MMGPPSCNKQFVLQSLRSFGLTATSAPHNNPTPLTPGFTNCQALGKSAPTTPKSLIAHKNKNLGPECDSLHFVFSGAIYVQR